MRAILEGRGEVDLAPELGEAEQIHLEGATYVRRGTEGDLPYFALERHTDPDRRSKVAADTWR